MKKKLILFLSIIIFSVFFYLFSLPRLSRNSEIIKEVYAEEEKEYDIARPKSESSYLNYLLKHKDAVNASSDIQIDLSSSLLSGNANYMTEKGTLFTTEGSIVTFNFDVPETGFYNLKIKYYPTTGNGLTIQRRIKIDDEYLFDELSLSIFYRLWKDNGSITEENGNEIRPTQIEAPEMIETFVEDRTRMIDGAYLFYLETGSHTLSFEAIREPMEIYSLSFTAPKEIKKYSEVLNEYNALGLKAVEGQELIKIQGENSKVKSSSSIYATSDNTSRLTENFRGEKNHIYQIRLNLIGGTNWSYAGDFIEWEVEAPEEGLYSLSFKYLQDTKVDLDSMRTLYINGEVPFEECKEIEFEYTKKFKLKTIGDKDGDFLFHLNKGTNRIRLEASLGKYADAIVAVQNLINSLNELYRKIIVITGVAPDINVDYQLQKFIPELMDNLNEDKKDIEEIIEILTNATDSKSEETIALNKLYDQICQFIENPYSISTDLSLFSSNISSLGTCLNNLMTQPLKIDYLGIHSKGLEKRVKVRENWLGKLWFEIRKLFISFFVDYDSLGSGTTGEENIEVWILTGRDQAQVVKNLVVNDFSVKNPKIGATIKLVPGSALLPNIQTGNGPDVVLMVGNATPNEYAYRNAAYDVSQFDDFDEVISNNYYESALTNLRYNGGVYGLPETITFPVLFYREDILSQLGLSVPNTWDEVIEMIIALQDNNMDFYLPASLTNTYASLLYQNGGEFYHNHGESTALSDEVAIEQFIKWTRFYTKYGIPVTANFTNRFRSGDMPIGISDYSLYNTLVMSAPEIQGKWKMTLIPGTEKEDGTIDRSSVSSGTACMILKDTEYPEASWEFLKWWTSADTQTAYGREIESILGASARYNAANINAIKRLPWSAADMNVLLNQYKEIKGFENVPGGYMMTRELDYAFRQVINFNTNPRETILEYSVFIDEELTLKRKEFGLE